MNLPPLKNRKTEKPAKPGKPKKPTFNRSHFKDYLSAASRAVIGFPGFLPLSTFLSLLLSRGGTFPSKTAPSAFQQDAT